MHDLSINYLGDQSILTHPLYVKWSVQTLGDIKTALAAVKNDVNGIDANMDNLAITSYLLTLIRIAGMI
tara:strand:+ start:369 stop:575 length:207 start_codon:yes stop_codon:yes gene_type:complete